MAPLLSKLVALGNLLAGFAASQASVTVDVGTKYQQIDGFGFSQAFGRAKEFQDAPASTRKKALDYLFNTTTGAGFSIIRNRVGSGGKGDSILPNSPGSPSGKPSYVWDGDDRGQFWFTKQAASYGVKTIIADAWSAPGFMKTSGSESRPGYLCGTTGHSCSSGDWRQAYADFLIQYVKYYNEAGLPVTHLGFLNEPDFAPSYSQMQISSNAQEAISFIPTLQQTAEAAGVNVSLTCCDAMGWQMQGTYTTALVKAGSTKYLGVITGHTYSSDARSPLMQTGLPKWNTEGGPGDGNGKAFVGTWYRGGADEEGFTWAQKIARAMVEAQLSAYLFWEGFEIRQTQSGSHLVDATDGSNPTPSGIFWAFAMWSRHIRPGARRVAATGAPGGVITGAFLNADGSVVVVFTNTGSGAQSVKTSFTGGAGSESPAPQAWLTNQGNTFASIEAKADGEAFTVSIPGRSVVTLKVAGGSGGKS
ncbi:glycoside hydrolase family 5 protein [Apiospora marii]|uniref:Glycoside hydrolase family 5 protein n=1 Tax=Apiospora marii TaxID=335849 RepID=A0ABR1SBE2_9PEZI